MEAPEKIYMPTELLSEDWTRHIEGEDIEYIRKDVFIDKACLWLKDNIDRYLYNTGGIDEYIPKCGGRYKCPLLGHYKKSRTEKDESIARPLIIHC